jgi:hypothetical protein
VLAVLFGDGDLLAEPSVVGDAVVFDHAAASTGVI